METINVQEIINATLWIDALITVGAMWVAIGYTLNKKRKF